MTIFHVVLYLNHPNCVGKRLIKLSLPIDIIDNWLRELKKWSPELKVLLYYGSQDDRREIRYSVMDGTSEEFNVVVTS